MRTQPLLGPHAAQMPYSGPPPLAGQVQGSIATTAVPTVTALHQRPLQATLPTATTTPVIKRRLRVPQKSLARPTPLEVPFLPIAVPRLRRQLPSRIRIHTMRMPAAAPTTPHATRPSSNGSGTHLPSRCRLHLAFGCVNVPHRGQRVQKTRATPAKMSSLAAQIQTRGTDKAVPVERAPPTRSRAGISTVPTDTIPLTLARRIGTQPLRNKRPLTSLPRPTPTFWPSPLPLSCASLLFQFDSGIRRRPPDLPHQAARQRQGVATRRNAPFTATNGSTRQSQQWWSSGAGEWSVRRLNRSHGKRKNRLPCGTDPRRRTRCKIDLHPPEG